VRRMRGTEPVVKLGSGDGPLSVRGCTSTDQGHPKILSKPLRRKHLRHPPLRVGASAPPPVRNQGPGRACPDQTRAIPCTVRAVIVSVFILIRPV